ncbi:hypothetical protein LINGRAHAP2_LOCUS23927, partial [Linum grandiflorum]
DLRASLLGRLIRFPVSQLTWIDRSFDPILTQHYELSFGTILADLWLHLQLTWERIQLCKRSSKECSMGFNLLGTRGIVVSRSKWIHRVQFLAFWPPHRRTNVILLASARFVS